MNSRNDRRTRTAIRQVLRILLSELAFLAFCCAAGSAWAGTNGFIVPLFRGSASSQAGYWETFTVPVGSPGNLPDQAGATTAAALTQTNANAFLTGSGNIYNLSTSAFVLADAVPYALGTVVLQTRTIGSELDYASVSLVCSNGSGAQALSPLFRYELNRTAGQGYSVSSLWQWDLRGLGVNSYKIYLNAAGPSLSFDAMTLDTAAQFGPAFTGQPFFLKSTPATLARWMYPFNASPGNRSAASVFSDYGSAGSYDTRDAQFLLGWNTSNSVPTGLGARNYFVRRARVTLTIASGNQYTYTGTLRDYRTYFQTNDPRYVAPATNASPVELFGAGFRGGYTALTFPQDGPFKSSGSAYYTNRNAYAAGFDTNGVLVDVSNNVGDDGTNEIAGAFEVAPFAVGQTTNAAPGQVLPVDSQLTFDLNLDDPLIYGYVQSGLNSGNLSFVASTLLRATFGGTPNYPNFYTIFNTLADPSQYPLLDLEGAVVRASMDGDADGLPDDWENFYFGSLLDGATNSYAGDGVSDLAKYLARTDPTNPAHNFRLLSVQPQSGGTELHFTFAPGRLYTLHWSDDLEHWQSVPNPALTYSSAWLAKAGTNVSYPAPVFAVWQDTNAAGPRRFYRVSAE